MQELIDGAGSGNIEQFHPRGAHKECKTKRGAALEPEHWTTVSGNKILAMKMIVYAGSENAMFVLVSQELR